MSKRKICKVKITPIAVDAKEDFTRDAFINREWSRMTKEQRKAIKWIRRRYINFTLASIDRIWREQKKGYSYILAVFEFSGNGINGKLSIKINR